MQIIQDNKTIHFYRNYFLSDSECPQTEDPYRNFGSPKQTVVIGLFYFFANLFGATKIPMGVLRLGTLRIREKIISIKMDCLVILYKLDMTRFTLEHPYSAITVWFYTKIFLNGFQLVELTLVLWWSSDFCLIWNKPFVLRIIARLFYRLAIS